MADQDTCAFPVDVARTSLPSEFATDVAEFLDDTPRIVLSGRRWE
ncbi:hypothetical protein [Nocardia xishanensis]